MRLFLNHQIKLISSHLLLKFMKNLLLVLIFIFSLSSFAQSSAEYFQNGIDKHNQKDYKSAIAEYSKAIKEDKTNKDAYFNRGNCSLAVQDYKSAMADLNKTIELDSEYTKAYYSRATIFVSQEKYKQALPDLDRTIQLDPTTSNALTLRGQLRAQLGNKEGACEDFMQAKQIGDAQADKYLSQFCEDKSLDGEYLKLDWPDEEKWKVASNQEDKEVVMIELVRGKETLQDWTEIGTMMSIKGAKSVPMDTVMTFMINRAKEDSAKAKLTFIEKDQSAEYPWIIFTIESPNFKNDKNPESQLWYIVQGKNALYTNFRAVKEASISQALKDKWIPFFKGAEVLYK